MKVEITNISSHGIWLFSYEKEYFLSYDDFPSFNDQTVKNIIHVEEQSHGHFYWPDVDLSEESIEFPEQFPLKAKID